MRNKFTTRILLTIILIGIVILAVPLIIANQPAEERLVTLDIQDFAYGMNNKNVLEIALNSNTDFNAKISVLKIVGNETQVAISEFTYTEPVSFSLGTGYYVIQVAKLQANNTLTLIVQESGYPLINLYIGAPLTVLGLILLIIEILRSRKTDLQKSST